MFVENMVCFAAVKKSILYLLSLAGLQIQVHIVHFSNMEDG